MSMASLHSSKTMKKRSKRDMMAGVTFRLARSVLVLSYLPPMGFAAAFVVIVFFKMRFFQKPKITS